MNLGHVLRKCADMFGEVEKHIVASGKAWGPVPPSVRAAVVSLGVTTMWSAHDWYYAMAVAVSVTVEKRRQEGLSADQCTLLRERLFAHLGSLPSQQLDSIATLTASSGLGMDVAILAFAEMLKYVADPSRGGEPGMLRGKSADWAIVVDVAAFPAGQPNITVVNAPAVPNLFASTFGPGDPSPLTGFCWRTVGAG